MKLRIGDTLEQYDEDNVFTYKVTSLYPFELECIDTEINQNVENLEICDDIGETLNWYKKEKIEKELISKYPIWKLIERGELITHFPEWF